MSTYYKSPGILHLSLYTIKTHFYHTKKRTYTSLWPRFRISSLYIHVFKSVRFIPDELQCRVSPIIVCSWLIFWNSKAFLGQLLLFFALSYVSSFLLRVWWRKITTVSNDPASFKKLEWTCIQEAQKLQNLELLRILNK